MQKHKAVGPQSRVLASLPKSATSIAINLTGLACSLLTLGFMWGTGFVIGPLKSALLFLASYIVPIVVLEFFLRKPLAAKPNRLTKFDLSRVCTKILGFYVVMAVFGFMYWVFPEYHRSTYTPYFHLVVYLIPILVVGSIPYFALMDRKADDPKDAYWHLGECFFGRWNNTDKKMILQLFLGWLVKAFFFPLMYTGLVGNLAHIQQRTFMSSFSSFTDFFNFAWLGMFTVDLLVAASGYLCTFRILDSQIRSTDSTLFGWFVALECYQPFWSFFSRAYLGYDEPSVSWLTSFSSNETFSVIWGSGILLLLGVYVAASLCFGIRFSNLTNRGVLTRGVYSWTKHPSYVSKNILWWMVSVPFFSHAGLAESVRHCFLLLGVNAVYFLRARTEEHHLSNDPIYVQYALCMNKRSLFRWLGQLFPYFRYDPNRWARNSVPRSQVES